MNEVPVTKYRRWEIVIIAKAAIKLQKGVFENMAFSVFGVKAAFYSAYG